MGSIGNVTWNDLKIFAPITIIGLLMSILLVKPLNLFLLGDNYAQTSGLNIKNKMENNFNLWSTRWCFYSILRPNSLYWTSDSSFSKNNFSDQ